MIPTKMMTMDAFAVPFQVLTLGEKSREMNKRLIADLHKDLENNAEAPLRTGLGVWQSNFKIENRMESYRELTDVFMDLAIPILRKAGFQDDIKSYMEIGDFWGNINSNPAGFHTPHFHGHGRTVFCGIYYPSSGVQDGVNLSDYQNLDELPEIEATSRPKPGSIVFMDPCINIKRQVFPLGEKLKRYPYYGLELCITPKEGTVVFFPHYLTHYTTPTEKPGFVRYSIPFTFSLKNEEFIF